MPCGALACRRLPERLRTIWWVRYLNHIGFAFLFGLLALLPLIVTSSSGLFVWTQMLIWSMVALSLTVLTGWSGQLSLSQMTFAGLGALSASAFDRGLQMDVWFIDFVAPEMPFLVAILLGALLASAIAALAMSTGRWSNSATSSSTTASTRKRARSMPIPSLPVARRARPTASTCA